MPAGKEADMTANPNGAEEILDTHLHLVDRARIAYPWLAQVPPLDRDWSLAEYAREARRVGIGRSIFMEVDVADTDIDAEANWVEELAATGSFPIAGIISACRPESERFPQEVERARARALVVGFRRVLHVVPDEVSQAEAFRRNIRLLATADLPFDVCVLARQLPLAIELVDTATEVRFVLDHCGVPDIAGDEWDVWAKNITEIARRPNVCAKVSGVIAYGGPDWTLAQLSRWVSHVIESFGPDRLCWGGDWPVCTLEGNLSTWVAASRALLAGLSTDERARIWRGTAAEIWGV
jgi:predicted TIM-barrel fold metal-dependent hydrolase